MASLLRGVCIWHVHMASDLMIPEGNTKIHSYPVEASRDEIWAALQAWALSPAPERMKKGDMVAMLNENYPGLDLNEVNLNYAVRRYVVPSIPNMLPAAILHGMADMGFDFNTARTKAEAIKKLNDQMDRLGDTTEDGRSTLPEKTAAVRTIIKGTESVEDTLERYGHIPSKKAVSEKTQVNINISKTASRHGFGRVIDADKAD